MAKTTGKRSVLWTVISVIVVLLVVVAVIGLIVHFTSDDKPPGGETFAVKYNGQTQESGSSVGLMDKPKISSSRAIRTSTTRHIRGSVNRRASSTSSA